MAAQTRNFSSSVEKHFTSESLTLSNCFMTNLNLQDDAQSAVFGECYVVKLLSCVA